MINVKKINLKNKKNKDKWNFLLHLILGRIVLTSLESRLDILKIDISLLYLTGAMRKKQICKTRVVFSWSSSDSEKHLNRIQHSVTLEGYDVNFLKERQFIQKRDKV